MIKVSWLMLFDGLELSVIAITDDGDEYDNSGSSTM
jgi:hypothetical protein